MPQAPLTRKDLETKLIAMAQSDATFRRNLLSNPTAALDKELNGGLAPGVKMKVVEESPDTFYLVLPPAQGELGDKDLDAVAGGTGFLTDVTKLIIGKGPIFSYRR